MFCLFVLFLLTIVLSVLGFMDSDYPVCIFELFLHPIAFVFYSTIFNSLQLYFLLSFIILRIFPFSTLYLASDACFLPEYILFATEHDGISLVTNYIVICCLTLREYIGQSC